MGRTLVVVHHITQMVSPAVVSFAHAHRVVREVDIAVVACATVSSDSEMFGSRWKDLQKTIRKCQ